MIQNSPSIDALVEIVVGLMEEVGMLLAQPAGFPRYLVRRLIDTEVVQGGVEGRSLVEPTPELR
jgi:hypothetical protein